MLVEGETSGKIIGAFYHVYNTLGFGFLESIYARSLEVALRKRGLAVAREVPFHVFFEDVCVGVHRIDMLVEHRVVVEIKASHVLNDVHQRQLLNYITALNLELGMLLHFGPKANFYRVLGRPNPNIHGAIRTNQDPPGNP
jgi:GxxExxY protein